LVTNLQADCRRRVGEAWPQVNNPLDSVALEEISRVDSSIYVYGMLPHDITRTLRSQIIQPLPIVEPLRRRIHTVIPTSLLAVRPNNIALIESTCSERAYLSASNPGIISGPYTPYTLIRISKLAAELPKLKIT
jgi:hypothetical protein